MERTTLSFDASNMFTVCLMVGIMFAAIGVGMRLFYAASNNAQ